MTQLICSYIFFNSSSETCPVTSSQFPSLSPVALSLFFILRHFLLHHVFRLKHYMCVCVCGGVLCCVSVCECVECVWVCVGGQRGGCSWEACWQVLRRHSVPTLHPPRLSHTPLLTPGLGEGGGPAWGRESALLREGGVDLIHLYSEISFNQFHLFIYRPSRYGDSKTLHTLDKAFIVTPLTWVYRWMVSTSYISDVPGLVKPEYSSRTSSSTSASLTYLQECMRPETWRPNACDTGTLIM